MDGPDRTNGTALLVIDLQADVVAGCLDAEGVLARTWTLVSRARAEDVPVVFVQHQDEDLTPGSTGWQLARPLQPRGGEPVIGKRYRDSFAQTELRQVLDRRGVRRLVVAGAQTEYCVRTTIQRAAVEGYHVVLVSDAHTTEDSEFDGIRIGAEQIIAHTNRYVAGLRYPGLQFGIAPHDRVELRT